MRFPRLTLTRTDKLCHKFELHATVIDDNGAPGMFPFDDLTGVELDR